MINEGKRGFKVRHKQKVASIEPPKPRNFVAKNAINTGAGAHKDKKKAMKQGDTKHKKDYAEGMEEKFQAQLDMLNEIKKGQKDANGFTKCWPNHHAVGTKKGKNGGRVRKCVHNESVAEEFKGNVKDTQLKNIDPDNHSDGEGDFVKNQLHTIKRVVTHLDNAIGRGEDLPDWVQSEIAQATDKIVGVMDYSISGKEQDIEKHHGGSSLMKEQGVVEGIKGAVVGGAAGALITKTPSGAMSGAKIGDEVGDMFENTDTEGAMAKQQLITAAKLAIKLAEQMDSSTQLDAWVQTKISLASDYIETVFDFLVHGEQDVDKEEETDEEVIPGITHQHRHGTLKHTSTTMEGAKVDRQAKHITKSMMKAHPGMSKEEAEGAAWAHIKHPKKKKKMKEDAYDIYLEVMLGKKLDK